MAVPTTRTVVVGLSSLTIPAAVINGDQLLLWIYSDSTTLDVPSVTNGTWTHDLSLAVADSYAYQFHRTATGSDANTSVSWTGTGVFKGVLVPIADSSGLDGVDGSATALSSTPRSTPTLATTVADCLALCFFAFDSSSVPSSPAWLAPTESGWTVIADDGTISGSRYLGVMSAKKDMAAAGNVIATAEPNGNNQESANIITAFAPTGGGGPGVDVPATLGMWDPILNAKVWF